jgi:hypothetical protein
LKILLGEEFAAAINGRYLKKYYPSIEVIVDCYYKHQKHGNSRHSGKKPPSEQKILTKENGEY